MAAAAAAALEGRLVPGSLSTHALQHTTYARRIKALGGPPVQTITHSVKSIYAGSPYAVREVFLHSKGCLHPNTYSENDFMVSAAVKGRRGSCRECSIFRCVFSVCWLMQNVFDKRQDEY